MVWWLTHWNSDLDIGGLSLVSAIVLLPKTRNFIPHCPSSHQDSELTLFLSRFLVTIWSKKVAKCKMWVAKIEKE